MEQALAFLDAQSPILIYLVLGVGSALENIFPPLPADTFVLLGGFLAGKGRATPWTVFVVTWLANVASIQSAWYSRRIRRLISTPRSRAGARVSPQRAQRTQRGEERVQSPGSLEYCGRRCQPAQRNKK